VGLSLTEQRSHFTLWAVMGGPLLISTDLRKISTDALTILKNVDIIAINQDALGRQGTPVDSPTNNGTATVYAKPLSANQLAVVLFNRAPTTATIELDLASLPTTFRKTVARDLWKHQELGELPRRSSITVAGHGVVALRLREGGDGGGAALEGLQL
jgi:alpha-galactosidase